MEMTIVTLCVVLAVSGMLVLGTALGVLVYEILRLRKETLPEPRQERQELPEEIEARKAAAEAQRRYEQGFVNLMSYDGSPRRKEEREQQ